MCMVGSLSRAALCNLALANGVVCLLTHGITMLLALKLGRATYGVAALLRTQDF